MLRTKLVNWLNSLYYIITTRFSLGIYLFICCAAVAASRLLVQSYIVQVFPVFWTHSVFILVLVDARWCAVSDCVITLSFIGRFIVFFYCEMFSRFYVSFYRCCSEVHQACRHDGYAYSRDCLLSVYSPRLANVQCTSTYSRTWTLDRLSSL